MSNLSSTIGGVDFEDLMALFGPFEEQPHIAVAVSGGADSLALTLLADEWAKEHHGTVTALTVDHGLRPESAGEARLVGVWLTKLGIEHHTLPWTGPKPKSGLQEAARVARYEIMADWCRQAGVLHLLTAHHRDDQVETYLMRAQQGSGPDGLSGMSAVKALRGCQLIRPFLSLPGKAPKDYLRNLGQDWVEDPSNHDERFTRIQIRQSIAEAELDTGKIANEVFRFGEDRIVSEGKVTELLARYVSMHPVGFAWIHKEMFDHHLSDELMKGLSRLASVVGGLSYPPRRQQVERFLKGTQKGKFATTLGHCRFVDYGKRVLICRESRNLPRAMVLTGDNILLWDARFECQFEEQFEEQPNTGATFSRTLKPLGDRGWQEIASQIDERLKKSIPDPVRGALPAIFDDQGVFSVPLLDYKRDYEFIDLDIELTKNRFFPPNSLSGSRFTVAKSI